MPDKKANKDKKKETKQLFIEVFDKHGQRRKTIGGTDADTLQAEGDRQAAEHDTFRPHCAPHTTGEIS